MKTSPVPSDPGAGGSPFPRFRELAPWILVLCGGWLGGDADAGEEAAPSPLFPPNPVAHPAGPEPVTDANFDALMSNSPFLRSLDLSDSLILTGIAHIDGDLFVTLYKPETKETHVVSDAANPQGMRLVGLDGKQEDLETVTARISLASGEVFSVRFDQQRLKPSESRPGGGSGGGPSQGGSSGNPPQDYRQGISGDGHSGPPPPHLVEKLSKLSEDQRNRLINEIRAIRDRGNVSSDDRRVLFEKMVDRALEERR